VTRSSVRVRAAGQHDLPAVLALLAECPGVTNRTYLRPPTGTAESVRSRYAALLADPDRRVLVAVDDGTDEVLGLTILVPDALGALLDERAVYLSHALVARQHQRRGAGRALVAAAVGYADENGYDHLVVGVAPGVREANRFYARLGFVPMMTKRIASVAVLRRSLGPADPVAELRRSAVRRRSRVGDLLPPRVLARPRARRDSA